MVSVSPFLEKLVTGWTFVLETYLSNIFIAIIYILGGLVLGKIAQTATVYVLKELEVRKIIKHFGIKKVDKLAGFVVAWTIYVISVFIALNILGVAFLILYVIGFLGVLLLAGSFVFGFRSFFPNFFYGFSLRRSPATLKSRTPS